jgi:amidohydrolase
MAKGFLTEEEKKILVEWRRDLHKNPELAFQEKKTSEFVEKRLSEFGIPFQKNVAGTGVVGLLEGKQGGKTLMVRSDMDALPVQEENDVDYKSKHDGVMHACGHDGHMAILLMTAKKMVEEKDFKGTIKFVFQPAEEVGRGAQAMIQGGVMKNPKVDGALGLHLWNNLPVGKIGITPGPILAAVDEFVIKIIGKGGHGAVPELTIDPVVTAGQVINTLQTLVSRSVSPLETVVVTIGAIHGGTTFNVIADEVAMKGTVRTYSMAIRDEMPQKFDKVLSGVTTAMGASYELDYQHVILPTINDPKMTDLAMEVAREVVGKENIIEGERTMGGEDMSYYLNEVPGCFIFVGSSNETKGINHSHHSSRFNIDEEALPIGVEILTKGIKKYLK